MGADKKKEVKEVKAGDEVYDPLAVGEQDLPNPDEQNSDDVSSESTGDSQSGSGSGSDSEGEDDSSTDSDASETDESVEEIDLTENVDYQVLSAFLENDEGVNLVDSILEVKDALNEHTKILRMFGRVMEKSLNELKDAMLLVHNHQSPEHAHLQQQHQVVQNNENTQHKKKKHHHK